MSTTTRIGRRAVLASAAALAGCNTILSRPAYVQRATWPLSVPPPASLRTEALRKPRKTLLVQDFGAAPGLDQQGVQWFNADHSVHVDFYNAWAVTPDAAVSNDALRWLAASGMFAAVVGPGSGITADLMLEGQLTGFIANPANLRGHVAFAITLVDPRVMPARVLLQTTLSAYAPMPKATPEGVVAAQRAALADVLGQLVRTLRRFA